MIKQVTNSKVTFMLKNIFLKYDKLKNEFRMRKDKIKYFQGVEKCLSKL